MKLYFTEEVVKPDKNVVSKAVLWEGTVVVVLCVIDPM